MLIHTNKYVDVANVHGGARIYNVEKSRKCMECKTHQTLLTSMYVQVNNNIVCSVRMVIASYVYLVYLVLPL